MSRPFVLCAGIIVLLIAGALSAQQAARERGDSTEGLATVTAVIVKVNAANRRVTLTNQDESVTVTVTLRTRIMRDGTEIRLSDLIVGQMARVVYDGRDLTQPAREIKVVDGQ